MTLKLDHLYYDNNLPRGYILKSFGFREYFMFKENLLHYFRAKLVSIAYNYGLALGANDEDGVHDLRVDLKRLKAYFNVIEALNDTFIAKKQFKRFKQIAKNTAMIRDAQVQQHIVKTATDTIGIKVLDYVDYLSAMEREGVHRFQRFSKQDHLAEIQKSESDIEKAIRGISAIAAETKAKGKFYNLRNDMLMLSSQQDLREELLHKVRKLSKETHYVFEIANVCFGLFEDNSKIFIKAIKKVHQALGTWHDYDVSLHFFETYMKKSGLVEIDEQHRMLADYYRAERDKFNNTFRTVFDEFKETAVTL